MIGHYEPQCSNDTEQKGTWYKKDSGLVYFINNCFRKKCSVPVCYFIYHFLNHNFIFNQFNIYQLEGRIGKLGFCISTSLDFNSSLHIKNSYRHTMDELGQDKTYNNVHHKMWLFFFQWCIRCSWIWLILKMTCIKHHQRTEVGPNWKWNLVSILVKFALKLLKCSRHWHLPLWSFLTVVGNCSSAAPLPATMTSLIFIILKREILVQQTSKQKTAKRFS